MAFEMYDMSNNVFSYVNASDSDVDSISTTTSSSSSLFTAGNSVTNSDGDMEVDSFLGIQYATQERFEHSGILLDEDGVINAPVFGDGCAQITPLVL